MNDSVLKFNGERCDPVSGVTHLGNGYRAYNPLLMRFHCPDAMSPFSAGGINPYAYCANDPMNRTDPSGHMSAVGNILLGLAAAVGGALLTVLTDGSALAVTGALLSGLISSGLSAGSIALEKASPVASAALSWIAIAAGFLSPGAAERGALRAGESALSGGKSGWIALGENPGNIASLGYDAVSKDVSAIFSDQENGVNQIIISAHGYQAPNQYTAVTRIHSTGNGNIRTLYGEDMGALMLAHREKHNVSDGYNMLLMCYSGAGGSNSAASRASAMMGDTVVGFDGPLAVRQWSGSLDMKLEINFHDARSRGLSIPDSLVQASARANRLVDAYRGTARNPYRYFEIDKMGESGIPYRPIVFFPDGSYRRGDYEWLHANSSCGLICDPPA